MASLKTVMSKSAKATDIEGDLLDLDEAEDDKKLDRLVFGVPQSEVETELGSVIKTLNSRLSALSNTFLDHQRISNELVAQHVNIREAKKKQVAAELKRAAVKSSTDGLVKSLDDGFFDSSRLVFLTKPPSDTAKRLESKLDEVHGAANFREAKSKTTKNKRKEVVQESEDQRVEQKKLIRVKLEKDLASNMESFMTRSITESSLSFVAPDDHDQEPAWPISINWPAPDPRNALAGNSHGEMCPDALLEYSLERVYILAGKKMFRSLLRLPCMVDFYVNLFWLCKVRLFQLDYSDRDELYLANRLSKDYSIFVSFVSEMARAEYEKDFVFRYMPFILSNAVHYGYYYLCPGSRHLLTRSFRKAAYILVCQFMFGVRITPLALKVVWTQIFPDDAAQDEAEDDEEFRPLNAAGDDALIHSHNSSFNSDEERFVVASLSKSTRPNSPCLDVALTPYGGTRAASSRRTRCGPLVEVRSENLPDTDQFTVQTSLAAQKREKPVLARQRSALLNLQSLSPLMRNYYGSSRKTVEKSVELLKMTVPVSNCVVGGSDTYKRRSTASSVSLCDDIAKKNKEILHRFEKCGRESSLHRKTTIDSLNADKKIVLGDSRLLSSRALELMKRKTRGGGYRDMSISSSVKDALADDAIDSYN